MNIGFTGTRNAINSMQYKELEKALEKLKNDFDSITVHHGDCVGADATFHEICTKLGFNIVIHPPNNYKNRAFCFSTNIREELSYIERNHNIVDSSEFIFAIPPTKNEIRCSGTWATIRYARKQNKRVIII